MSAAFKLSCSSKINVMFQEFNTPGSIQMMLVDGPLPWSPNKEKSLQVVYLYWALFLQWGIESLCTVPFSLVMNDFVELLQVCTRKQFL